MELYIIRHAQSYNNALPNQKDRVPDPHLTELGLQQADLVARHLAEGVNLEMRVGSNQEATHTEVRQGFGITKLYCSAMFRAMQTAKPISTALGLTPEIWIDIHEHGGIYTTDPETGQDIGLGGKTRSEIMAEFPGYVITDAITEAGWWTGGFEPWVDCHGRAIRVAMALRHRAWEGDTHNTERIAIVTHGGFIDALIKALLNHSPSPGYFHHNFNTGISFIHFTRYKHIDIRYLNRIGHLPAELVS